jgi:GAF domain-containing protein
MLGLLAHRDSDVLNSPQLCAAAATFTHVSGAGILLLSPGPHYTPFCASDEKSHRLLETEITLGEGPAIDACRFNIAIDDIDLMRVSSGKWLAYGRSAADIGARAVFGFPVSIGAIRIGALVLYHDRPGPLSELQESDAYLAASVVGRAILNWRAGASRETLTSELGLTFAFDFSVHQAAGMVAVQANLDLGDAMVLMRAHATGSGVTMTELARNVVGRKVGYDSISNTWRDEEAPNI